MILQQRTVQWQAKEQLIDFDVDINTADTKLLWTLIGAVFDYVLLQTSSMFVFDIYLEVAGEVSSKSCISLSTQATSE